MSNGATVNKTPNGRYKRPRRRQHSTSSNGFNSASTKNSSLTFELNNYVAETQTSNEYSDDNDNDIDNDDLIAVSSPNDLNGSSFSYQKNSINSPSFALPLNYYFKPTTPIQIPSSPLSSSSSNAIDQTSKSPSNDSQNRSFVSNLILRRISKSSSPSPSLSTAPISSSSPTPILSPSIRSQQSQLSSSDYLSSSGTTSQPLPSQVPRGLINLGNTCYMNATLQSLYSIDAFRSFILNSYQGKTLTAGLRDVFKEMKKSNSPVSPADLRGSFARYQSKFSGYGQQDAQEFLRYLINGIHEEFNQANHRPRRSPNANRTSPKTSNEAWLQYREIVDDSPLVDIVVGQLCSTIVCSVCQNKSLCWDPFWDLSLPLARRRHSCNLADVVADFTSKETLDSDERPICEHCKRATRSTKQINVCRLPKVMILHLKKFTNDGYKLTSPTVEINKTLTFDNTSYHLKACISHHGHSSSSGHYTSHCKYDSSWFHFNDDR